MRNDETRLAALRRLLILDSAPERAYDDITRLVASTLDVPIAMVNLLDEQRDWFKACIGLPQRESPASTSFCEAFFRSDDSIIVANDTATDERFANHPLVVGPPHIRFYAAARLEMQGQTVGTLCAYHLEPRQTTDAQLGELRRLAEAVMQMLAQRG